MTPEKTDETQLAKAYEEYGIKHLPTPEQVAISLSNRYKDLPEATNAKGYEANRAARGELVKLRTMVEKRRVELKADSLAYGRRIDGFAKFMTAAIESVEEPIRKKIKDVDDAKEREKKDRKSVV